MPSFFMGSRRRVLQDVGRGEGAPGRRWFLNGGSVHLAARRPQERFCRPEWAYPESADGPVAIRPGDCLEEADRLRQNRGLGPREVAFLLEDVFVRSVHAKVAAQ